MAARHCSDNILTRHLISNVHISQIIRRIIRNSRGLGKAKPDAVVIKKGIGQDFSSLRIALVEPFDSDVLIF
jgi:hypothetical protein